MTNPAAGNVLAMADVPPLDPTQPTPVPWGRILAPFAPVPGLRGRGARDAAAGREVPPAGVQVRRAWRYARWSDGRQLSWVGRRVRPGTGPGASGLHASTSPCELAGHRMKPGADRVEGRHVLPADVIICAMAPLVCSRDSWCSAF